VIIKVKVVAMSELKTLSDVLYAFYCDVMYGTNGEKMANHGKKKK
jgi:hypothetical protein